MRKLSKQATRKTEITMLVKYSEAAIKNTIKSKIKKKWQQQWDRGDQGRL